MLSLIYNYCQRHRAVAFSAIVLLSLALYLLGLTFVLILLIPAVLSFSIRFPKIINSFFSRYIVSIFFLYSIIQIAATLQFLLIPSSNFKLLSVLVTIIAILLIIFLPSRRKIDISARKLFSSNDLFALLGSMLFVVPMLLFAIFCSSQQLASIGGIQGIDGVNHFAFISEMNAIQHYPYKVGAYYPYGFHHATAFIESGLGLAQSGFSWLMAAKFYFIQYAIFGGLLLYGMFYLVISFTRALFADTTFDNIMKGAIALSLGLCISIFYYTSFIYHGFLSYFYICAALVFGFLYLLDFSFKKQKISKVVTKDKLALTSAFLIITLGASVNWVLWTPAILLTAFLFVIHKFIFSKANVFSSQTVLLLVATILNLIPIYFQLKFSIGDASQGINLTGGLRIFHFIALGLGVAVLMSVIVNKNTLKDGIRVVQQIFIPILILLGLLIFMQFFAYGEVRYYAIKSSIFVEILLLVLCVAIVAAAYAKRTKNICWYVILFLPLTFSLCLALVLSASGNPLSDARQLFRNYNNEPKPAFFDNDASKLSKLGESGYIKKSNVISLHISDNSKLFTHMQLFYWANVMGYGGTSDDRDSLRCVGSVYGNLFAQDFSDESQQKLITTITECAASAKANSIKFYIVSDSQSSGRIKELFNDNVEVVY